MKKADNLNENFEEQIKKSKDSICDSKVNNPKTIFERSLNGSKKETSTIFTNTLFLRYTIMALLVVSIVVGSIAIFKKPDTNLKTITYINSSNNNSNENSNNNNNNVMQIESTSQLEQLVKNSTTSSSITVPGYTEDAESDVMIKDSAVGSTGAEFNGTTSIDRIYETNNQETGVDEADIVKVNGSYIYYIPQVSTSLVYNSLNSYSRYVSDEPCVYILNTNKDNVELTKKISFTYEDELIGSDDEISAYSVKKSQPINLYTTDKYLVVQVQTNTYTQLVNKLGLTITSGYTSGLYYNDYHYYTEFFIYDIKTIELVTTVKTAGNNISTRLIGDELYIINNYYDYLKNDYVHILPTFFIDDILVEPAIERFYYCPNFGMNINSFINIYKVTLGNEIKVEDLYFLAPQINKVYATTEKIYLIRNYGTEKETIGNVYSSHTTSKIFIVDIEDGLKAEGMIQVKGSIQDQYWIDQNNDYLFVASTGTKYTAKVLLDKFYYNGKSVVFNYLTVFKKTENGFEQVNIITDGIGEPGETIRSVRFNNNVATIVTYRNIDPLYYIDLTDPMNPTITSELKVTGYSVYQHPYKDNYMIGFGYETSSSGSITGYKIALFDISDKTNIKEVGTPLIFSQRYSSTDYRYYYFEGLDKPKTLMFDLDNSIFGFTIYRRLNKQTTYSDSSTSSYTNESCYYVLHIDENSQTPITILSETTKLNKSVYSAGSLERMVFIGDYYYLLSREIIYVYQLDNGEFKETKQITL